jgi:micrococcal nuclease
MSRLFPAIVLACLASAFILIAGCTLHSGDGGDAKQFIPGVAYPAQVIHVTDGDTLRVTFPDGSQETVRVLGVDTPEVSAAGNDPGSFEGISDPIFLESWGGEAALFLHREVEGQVVTVTTDGAAGERDRYGRLLAYVHSSDGTDIGELLLSKGMARVYTAESFARKDHYLAVQDDAMRKGIGVWSGVTPAIPGSDGVFITAVHYDAAGDDRTNLNDEYIILKNGGGTRINLATWQIRDSNGFTATLPDTSLAPGSELILHIGSGVATGTDLYLGSPAPVLNNDGDSVTLYDPAGVAVSAFAW